MTIDDIPFLPKDQPLFSWDDHPESLAALVSGGDCAAFKIDTWNAIVIALANALIAGDLGWNASQAYYADTLMTKESRDLSAARFNSVLTNAELFFEIKWGWQHNWSFRGYTGLKKFAKGDTVYPEYIKELVRGVNLFIETVRGTGPILNPNVLPKTKNSAVLSFGDPHVLDSVYAYGVSGVFTDILLKPTAPMFTMLRIVSRSFGNADKRPSAPMFGDKLNLEKTLIIADADQRPSKPMYSPDNWINTWNISYVEQRPSAPIIYRGYLVEVPCAGTAVAFRGAFLSYSGIYYSLHSANSAKVPRLLLGWYAGLFNTIHCGVADQCPAAVLGLFEYVANTLNNAIAAQCPSFPLGKFGDILKSLQTGTVAQILSAPVESSVKTLSRYEAQAVSVKSIFTSYSELITSESEGNAASLPSAPVATAINLILNILAAAAALPPAPLKVRAVGESVTNGAGDAVESFPIVVMDCGMSGVNTVVELVPTARMEVRDRSKANVAAGLIKDKAIWAYYNTPSACLTSVTVDSAWYPPVQTGKSVYFKQVYDYALTDGVLEVY